MKLVSPRHSDPAILCSSDVIVGWCVTPRTDVMPGLLEAHTSDRLGYGLHVCLSPGQMHTRCLLTQRVNVSADTQIYSYEHNPQLHTLQKETDSAFSAHLDLGNYTNKLL